GVYVKQILWPTKLSIFYPITPKMFSNGQVLIVALLLVSATVLVLFYRRHKYLVMGWFCFVGVLLPLIGLVQAGIQAHAHRHLYLPIIGLLILVVWAFAEAFDRLAVPVWMGWMVSLIVLTALSWDTRIQMKYWHDSISVFKRSLEVTPQSNYLAHFHLAL